MSSNKTLFLTQFFVLFLFTTAYSQLEQPGNEYFEYSKTKLLNLDSTGVDSFITAKMSEYNIPGLSACIVRDGKILWNNAYGYSNFSLNKEVNDSTSFLLASISKTIVCTAIMQLWEEGLFNLDDDINNYLPPDLQVINPYYPNDIITFRMLLTHTSSIDRDDNLLTNLISWGMDSPVSIDSCLRDYLVPGGQYYSFGPYLGVAPGTQYSYSNFGVALVGYLVEIIADTSLDGYCNQNIFDPLNMSETGWFLSDLDSNNIATPYNFNGSTYQSYGYYGNPAYPCGWLKSSAPNLARFLLMFMNGGQYGNARILDSTTVELIKTVQYPLIAPGFGLIWYTWSYGSNLYRGHNGGLFGCITEMDYLVGDEDGLGVIVLTSGNSINGMREVWAQLFEFGEYYKKIYPQNVRLNSSFMQVNTDTLIFNTEFVNHNNHNFSANALITSIDSVYTDSFPLYDDGNHGDIQAADGIWGNYMLPISTENEFMVGVSTVDLDSGGFFELNGLSRFTTIGPVVVDSLFTSTGSFVLHPGDSILMALVLKNMGSVSSAQNISSDLTSGSPCVKRIVSEGTIYGNINPGQTATMVGAYTLVMNDSCPNVSSIKFDVSINSNGYTFWSDSIFFDFVTDIKQYDEKIPLTYSLKQNYPNPFNPRTTIEFSISKNEFVSLKIYNLLGQKVASLVDQKLTPGNYKYNWDASGFASGVYIYRLYADNPSTGSGQRFVQSCKMLLLR